MLHLLKFMSFLQRSHKLKATQNVIAMLMALSPVYGLSDELDTVQFRAGLNKVHDNNLFRRASNEVSEEITTTTLGAKLDKTYSLQRIVLDLNLVDNKYNVNDYLNFTATNYSAAWNWSLTPEITGSLSSDRTQGLNSFGDVRVTTQRNIRTTTMNQFKVQYSPHNVWTAILGFSQMSLQNSETFTAISDFDASGLDYGLMYLFPSGSNIHLMGHNRRGEFTKRPLDPVLVFDNGYDEKEYELELMSQDPGKDRLTAKVGYLERSYDNFTIRNYSSYIANVIYELQITGKLKSNFTLSRTLAPFETSNSTYSLSDNFSGRLFYQAFAKVQVGINASYGERSFEGRGQFSTSDRTDRETSYGAFVRWNPIKNIGFNLSSTKSNRNSSLANFDYDDTLTSVSVDLRI
jgi:exopolysaccharide biosynthesis operon protein EpsL